jgi:uncharacterized protein YjbJ (UPF0337 family)
VAKTGPAAGVSGIVEDVKGKVKEVAGEVTGNKSLEREGSSQQDKAAADREVAEHEAKAEAARGQAELHESRERVAQED